MAESREDENKVIEKEKDNKTLIVDEDNKVIDLYSLLEGSDISSDGPIFKIKNLLNVDRNK